MELAVTVLGGKIESLSVEMKKLYEGVGSLDWRLQQAETGTQW